MADSPASGIELAQQSRTEHAIERVPTAIAAFVGRTLKGPVNQAQRITSFSEFQQHFGGLWQPSTLSYAVEQFFENGEDLDPVIGPGPDNPLGKYAFYLQWPSYLIHGTNKPAGVGLRSSHGCIRLYPEDIAQFFAMVPLGTQVRVVNQPFVFGWRDGQLYMQPFDVLEDDTRDWAKAPRRLLSKSLAATLQQQLKAHETQVDWTLVSALAHNPRGVPVPITVSDATVEQVLADAPRVQNVVPQGSTWDGKSDLPMDEVSFKQMLSEIEPGAPGEDAAEQTADAPAPAAAAKAPRDRPKNGG